MIAVARVSTMSGVILVGRGAPVIVADVVPVSAVIVIFGLHAHIAWAVAVVTAVMVSVVCGLVLARIEAGT